MKTTAILYGLCLAAGALLLRWLESTYAVRTLPPEVYVLAAALAFTALGLWSGRRADHADLGGNPPEPASAAGEAAERLVGAGMKRSCRATSASTRERVPRPCYRNLAGNLVVVGGLIPVLIQRNDVRSGPGSR